MKTSELRQDRKTFARAHALRAPRTPHRERSRLARGLIAWALALALAAPAIGGTGVARAAADAPAILEQTRAGLPRLTAGKALIERVGSVIDDAAGPFAQARGGDWRLANDKMTLFFAATDNWPATASMPLAGYHGTVDADDRKPGALLDVIYGADRFDVMSQFTQGIINNGSPVPIAYDTSKPVRRGKQVGLRLEGSPYGNSAIRLETTYWLEEGASRVSIESRVLNLGPNDPVPALNDLGKWHVGMFLDMGHAPLQGGVNATLSGRYYALRDGSCATALAPTTGTLTGRYFGNDNVLATTIRPAKGATGAKRSKGVTDVALEGRALWLGDGSFSSIHGPILKSRGERMGILKGVFKRKANPEFQEPQTVSVFRLEPGLMGHLPRDSKKSKQMVDIPLSLKKTIPDFETMILSDLKGAYQAELPEGFYAILPQETMMPFIGLPPVVHVIAGQVTPYDFLDIAPRTGTWISVVDDKTSQPLAARVMVDEMTGMGAAPFFFNPKSSKLASFNQTYVAPGQDLVEMAPGKYSLKVLHGPRYKMDQTLVTVDKKAPRRCTIRLSEVSPTPGWIGVEMGARTTATPGCALTDAQVALMAAAEGLDWVISGDYEKATDLGPAIRKLGLTGRLRSSRGFRTLLPAHPEWGHLFVFPIAEDDPDPAVAAKQWKDLKTSTAWIAAVRKLYPNALIQVDTPVTPQGTGYLSRGATDPYAVGWDHAPDACMDFDAIDVLPARAPWDSDVASNLWLSLLCHGRLYVPSTTPLGRMIYGGEPGYPRLLARVSDKPVDLANLSESKLFRAIAAKHVQLSNGAFIDARVGDALPGDMLSFAAASTGSLSLRVTSSNWNVVNNFRIDKDGNMQHMLQSNADPSQSQRYPDPSDGKTQATHPLSGFFLSSVKDTLLTVRAWGPPMNACLPFYVGAAANASMALTMPIVIDANGNGRYDGLKFFSQRGT
jgi:hypothetical protein